MGRRVTFPPGATLLRMNAALIYNHTLHLPSMNIHTQSLDFLHLSKRSLSFNVSVRFRTKERGTGVKLCVKNGATKMSGRVGKKGRKQRVLPSLPLFRFSLSFHFLRGQNRKSRSSVFLCSETRKRLLRRLTQATTSVVFSCFYRLRSRVRVGVRIKVRLRVEGENKGQRKRKS